MLSNACDNVSAEADDAENMQKIATKIDAFIVN
jgi:hypothetical protein